MQQKEDMSSKGPIPSVITNMDSKWKNWWIRTFFTIVMVAPFCGVVFLGPIVLSLLVVAIFLKCFQEIISIGYSKYKEYNLPLYRLLNWYFLFVSVYFLYGDNFFFYYTEYRTSIGVIGLLSRFHRIISFSFYLIGFVMFVLTLKKDFYQIQFAMFGWTHLTLFVLGCQAYLVIQNVFEGLFWFLLPVTMVICNDIMAYFFGFFFGRTRLIKLSPKKTWEGFLGAFVSTVLFGFVFSYVLAKFDYFICYDSECERLPMFILQEYHIGSISIHLYPAQLHSIPLSVFASLIAPFGGFFASGFKRANNIKDFSDVIPGHGGIMDRFDCQMLMATFANIYYFTFCGSPHPDKLLSMVFALPVEKQLHILEQLKEKLSEATGTASQ